MNSPTHEEVTHRAHQLWLEYGRPAGRDREIWLMAEHQLTARAAEKAVHEAALRAREAHKAAKHDAPPAESVAGQPLAPTIPDAPAQTATRQKHEARAPQVPHHTAPHAKPAETGKPLWNQPHSS